MLIELKTLDTAVTAS